MTDSIKALAKQIHPDLLRIRHHLHAHPELSYEEYQTAGFIAAELESIGIEYQKEVAGTGIVALIKGNNPDSKCIALRADMDALPVEEANNIDYKSQNRGVMHACGHDVHTTCLLGAARILHHLKDSFEGTIKLLFQPGEEQNPGGASLMIAAGVLENPKPAAIVALHVFPELPAGCVGFRPGQYMASSDEIFITVAGRGGHAALPHTTVDPISIAAQIIVALQQVVSRKCDPLIPTVLSFGKIAGGHTTNVIPDKVELAGTLRTFDEAWRYQAHQLIRDIATQTASSLGGKAIVEIPKGYPSLYNDPELTSKVRDMATHYIGNEHVKDLDLRMTAEDFSFYAQRIPGCFFRLGTNKNNEYHTAPVHTPHFNINEDALPVGAGLMAYIAFKLLAG